MGVNMCKWLRGQTRNMLGFAYAGLNHFALVRSLRLFNFIVRSGNESFLV